MLMPKPERPSVLLLTNPSDLHSLVIAEALRRKGVPVSLWHGSDFPSRQLASIQFDETICDWEAHGPELEISNQRFSSVWRALASKFLRL
jgi:hypothetical protein